MKWKCFLLIKKLLIAKRIWFYFFFFKKLDFLNGLIRKIFLKEYIILVRVKFCKEILEEDGFLEDFYGVRKL